MKGKSVLTNTIRRNEITALFECWVANRLSKFCAYKKQCFSLYISNNVLKCWSVNNLSSFSVSLVKLCAGGFWKNSISWTKVFFFVIFKSMVFKWAWPGYVLRTFRIDGNRLTFRVGWREALQLYVSTAQVRLSHKAQALFTTMVEL